VGVEKTSKFWEGKKIQLGKGAPRREGPVGGIQPGEIRGGVIHFRVGDHGLREKAKGSPGGTERSWTWKTTLEKIEVLTRVRERTGAAEGEGQHS